MIQLGATVGKDGTAGWRLLTWGGMRPLDLKGAQVRVVELEGNPWFVAADVCRALGMYLLPNGQPNATGATRRLGDDEKGRN